MKNTTLKKTLPLLLLSLLSVALKAQTNVSGGIYANTAWTKANSPYIVTDTVVVFPGVTLTIEPGVAVFFDDKMEIEIRQGQFIANGTTSDSIIFTSHSSSPSAGIYTGVYLNGGNLSSSIRYCSFYYAATGLNSIVYDTLTVTNCYFSQDSIGLQCASMYVQFDSCNFIGNAGTGLIVSSNGEISQCNLLHNGTGIFWSAINLFITNCNISLNSTGMTYSAEGCFKDCYTNDYVNNCIFDSNALAISGAAWILFDSCTISHNQTGFSEFGPQCPVRNCIIDSNLVVGSFDFDSLGNCTIKYNGTGISMNGGELVGSDIEYNKGSNISCNNLGEIIEGNIIKYGSVGIAVDSLPDAITTITNNIIENNGVGIDASGHATITMNVIENGDVGIEAGAQMTITKNVIENNGIGVIISGPPLAMTCNRICSDSSYDLKYEASSNINVSDNYWCTNDSASIRAKIYDGYDNIDIGIVTFMPLDTLQCYAPTGIPVIEQPFAFKAFPNPFSNSTEVMFGKELKDGEVLIYNVFGQQVSDMQHINGDRVIISRGNLCSGVYIYAVLEKQGMVGNGKLVVE